MNIAYKNKTIIMSETLLGVIIGGFIGLISTSIMLIYNYIRWKKENKITYLKEKKDKLEKDFQKAYKELLTGFKNGSYEVYTMMDLDFVFPKNVKEAFDSFIKTDHRDEKKHQLYNVAYAMKNELVKIEKEIEREII